MTDWGGKLAGATVRIAGLLHLAEHCRDGWDRPITAATLQAATEIGDYYTAHAKAAYDTIGADPATAHARAILQWLHTTRPAQITARDLMRAMRDRFPKSRRPHRTPGHPRITRLDTPATPAPPRHPAAGAPPPPHGTSTPPSRASHEHHAP